MNADEIFQKLNWTKATPKRNQTNAKTSPQKGIVSELIEAERERKRKRKIEERLTTPSGNPE